MGGGGQGSVQTPEQGLTGKAGDDRFFDDLPRLAQRAGECVDGQGRFVPEEVTSHGRQHEGQGRVHRGHADDVERTVETRLPIARHHDGRRLVSAVDGDFLGHVIGRGTDQPGRTHEDERFRRQVDVLLVLGDVAGDGLVTELAELHPHLLGGHLVGAAADDRPVAPVRGEAASSLGDVGPAVDDRAHGLGQLAQLSQDLVAPPRVAHAGRLRDGAGEQGAGGHLGVEGLRGGHAHLHVAAVGGVEHAVGLVGEIAVAPVHDGDDRSAAGPGEVHGAVRVGGGAALAHGDDERVAHVHPQVEAGQLGGRDGPHVEALVGEVVEQGGRALAGNGGRALADDPHGADAATSQALHHGRRQRPRPEDGVEQAIALADLAPKRLAKALGRLRYLLQQEVRRRATIDVPGGHLSGDDIAFAEG